MILQGRKETPEQADNTAGKTDRGVYRDALENLGASTEKACRSFRKGKWA